MLKCNVPRMGHERTIFPEASASSTMASVEPGARSPTAHFAAARSCACMASIQRTTSAGSVNELPRIRWLANRSRATVAFVLRVPRVALVPLVLRVALTRPSMSWVRDHGLASKTTLNGVAVARANRVKPPWFTTARSLASPA
jgi:hypothetical protein